MTNYEKYKRDIEEIFSHDNIAVGLYDGAPHGCRDMQCKFCAIPKIEDEFCNCRTKVLRWLMQDAE